LQYHYFINIILQKRIVRIITNTGVRESCREAFKNMEIMTYSPYIFSLILFAVKNKHLFTSNKEIHTYKTRNYLNFHLPTVNLTNNLTYRVLKLPITYLNIQKSWSMIWNASNYLSRSLYVIILFIQLKNTTNYLMTKTCKLTVILILFILLLYAIF
jgi:hypothetical protein